MRLPPICRTRRKLVALLICGCLSARSSLSFADTLARLLAGLHDADVPATSVGERGADVFPHRIPKKQRNRVMRSCVPCHKHKRKVRRHLFRMWRPD